MLRDIKQKSSGLGFKIVMALIIISFVFWGVTGSLMQAGSDVAAKVNGEVISITDYNQALSNTQNRYKSQFGDNIGSEFFETENFKKGVMSQLVDSELLRQEAAKFDFDVSPKAIKEYISSVPAFQIDGKFNEDAYINYLNQVRKSASLLERDVEDDLKSSAFPQMVTSSTFALEYEISNQYKLDKQKRNFDYVELTSSNFEDKVSATDEEIDAHYKEFSKDYMTQEQVSVNYIELSTKDLLDQAEVSEGELERYYEAKKSSLTNPEKRKAQHILLTVKDGNKDEIKKQIDEIAKRLKDGENFEEVAKEISQDPGSAKSGGDLGMIAPGDMVEAFDKKLFSMNIDEISEPVLSNFGYHIIKLNEIKPPEIPSLDESRITLTNELKKEKASDLFLSKADELSTQVIDADNVLELAADASSLEMKATELFARGRGTGIAANPNFMKTVFTDAIKVENEVSEMIDLGENHIAYVQIKEHLAPTVKPLEEVKESIKKKLISEKAINLMREEVKKLVSVINAKEKTLEVVAKDLGKEVVVAENIERVGSKQPFQLVKNVFALSLNKDDSQVKEIESAANKIAIVQLNSILDGDSSAMTEEDKTRLSSQLERTSSNNELATVITYLKDDASVYINDKIFITNQ